MEIKFFIPKPKKFGTPKSPYIKTAHITLIQMVSKGHHLLEIKKYLMFQLLKNCIKAVQRQRI